MLQKRLVFEWWAILAFACALAFLAAERQWTQRIDNLLLDQAIPFAAAPASDDILIVEIDERTLAEVGNWPWPRATHARLIAGIAKAKPKAIGYDVLLIEPGDAADDAKLSDAIASAGNVVLPFQYQIPGSNGREVDVLQPFAPLPSVAAAMGHVGLNFDPDGIVRRVELQGHRKAFPFAHLMEATRKVGLGKSEQPAGLASLPSGETLLPLLPRTSYRTIPAVSIIRGQVAADFIKGKFVLVGATAQGMADIFPVPASAGSSMSGVEIQGNLLNGLLANRFVSVADEAIIIAVALVAIFGLMTAFWRFSPRANLLLSLALIAICLAGSVLLVVLLRVWVPPGPTLLAILLLYPLWGWRRLAALDSFIGNEARRLGDRDQAFGEQSPAFGLDAVARKAMRLQGVIGELADRESFIASVIGAAPDAIFVTDGDGRIVLANASAHTLFGEGVTGKMLGELMKTDAGAMPEHGAEWTSPAGKVLLTSRSILEGNQRAFAGTIFSLSEITTIRDAERERKETLEFLSHDMRSPQAAIVSLVDGTRHSASVDHTLLARIRSYALQTLQLTDDFVQLARLETAPVRWDIHDLSDLMEEAIDANYALAKSKSVPISFHRKAEALVVSADGATLVRALSNLIGNAVKYGSEGSAVSCTAHSTRGHVCCEIADRGPGLPQLRLKDPFGRFGHRDESQQGGAGLGLAFVKRAVEINLGEISWTSSPHEGTCFTLCFTAVTAP